MSRQFGECDLCRKEIEGRKNETVLILRASYMQMERRAYTLEYRLCPECAKKFEHWISVNMEKDAPEASP